MNTLHEPWFGMTLGWIPIVLVWTPLCAWGLYRIGRMFAPGPIKWATLAGLLLVMAAIPLGDDAYIQRHFNRLCRDAGLHLEKKIEVDGFYNDTSKLLSKPGPISSPHAIEAFERRGFQFFESRSSEQSGKYTHIEKIGGQWQVTVLDHPTARYHYKLLLQHGTIGFRLAKWEEVIVDAQTDVVVARQTIYTRHPGWLDGLWLGFFDNSGTQCPTSGSKKRGDLLTTALVPSKQR